MPHTIYARNKKADAINYDSASIHTGDPGDNGASNEVRTSQTQQEIDAGLPAYARKPISFAAAVAGSRDSNNSPLFDIPAGTNISHYALWEGGNCVATGTLQNSESYTGQGTYELSDVDVTVN